MSFRATYLPHAVYATAIVSLSLHLLSKRRESEDLRRRAQARITVLESLVNRFESGEHVSDDEILRMRKMVHGDPQSIVVREARGILARPRVGVDAGDVVEEDNVNWKTVVAKDDMEVEKIRREPREGKHMPTSLLTPMVYRRLDLMRIFNRLPESTKPSSTNPSASYNPSTPPPNAGLPLAWTSSQVFLARLGDTPPSWS